LALGRLVILKQPAAPTSLAPLVATIDQMEGAPRRLLEPDSVTGPAIRLADSIRAGEWIVTDDQARVGLRFRDGTSVRLDVLSRARLLSVDMIELGAGAVYVDTERESGHFEVRTSLATARDLGTQFEVRLVDEGLRLRVRSGLVELTDGGRRVSGRGGTEVMFSGTGAVSRPIAPHGSDWEWITKISPVVEIEGLALSTFLDRLSREHGWTLRYQDPALAKRASQIVLHGSVKGLRPEDALDVAIATSGLHHRLERGELIVWAASDSR
jgi:ferric-dicitrate binding protein FerR (iron transport regulator)